MVTYTNKWGQIVTHTATNTGMLPTDAANDYVIDADEQTVGGVKISCNAELPEEAVEADLTVLPDASGLPSPYAEQYRGSSGSDGGFPETHA